jgi:hypothetical protein
MGVRVGALSSATWWIARERSKTTATGFGAKKQSGDFDSRTQGSIGDRPALQPSFDPQRPSHLHRRCLDIPSIATGARLEEKPPGVLPVRPLLAPGFERCCKFRGVTQGDQFVERAIGWTDPVDEGLVPICPSRRHTSKLSGTWVCRRRPRVAPSRPSRRPGTSPPRCPCGHVARRCDQGSVGCRALQCSRLADRGDLGRRRISLREGLTGPDN